MTVDYGPTPPVAGASRAAAPTEVTRWTNAGDTFADIDTRLTAAEAVSYVERIATQTLVGGETSVSFSSIPGTYKDLELIMHGRMASNVGAVQLQFNGDSGANYDENTVQALTSSMSVAEVVGGTAGTIGTFGTTSPLGSSINAVIANYASTTHHKSYTSQGADKRSSATGGFRLQLRAGHWRNAAAITQITVVAAVVGGFAADTVINLYGRK